MILKILNVLLVVIILIKLGLIKIVFKNIEIICDVLNCLVVVYFKMIGKK